MSEQEVFEVVCKHLTTIVPTIPKESVVHDASMRDLGASSLDIVEVVSCSMRELRVRVPRAELQGLKNIGQLVALLHKTGAGGANAPR
ncbi:MAG: acyl carrier protein [Deltaproteobacteria bacterium]|nr:acyl carrier protein [Deltaproteobacteria bacterium]